MFVLSHPASRLASPQFSRFIDRLFDESMVERSTPARTPALDVSESDGGYTLSLDVPGVSREQLKVSIEGRRVSIETAEVKTEGDAQVDAKTGAEPAAPRMLYRERSVARFARTVTLPAEVDQAASSAKFENGVLTLTLAKKVPTGATQLQVA